MVSKIRSLLTEENPFFRQSCLYMVYYFASAGFLFGGFPVSIVLTKQPVELPGVFSVDASTPTSYLS